MESSRHYDPLTISGQQLQFTEGHGDRAMPRALVIDDERIVRDTISLLLKAQGFEVIEAERGDDGLKKLKESDLDLVIVDIYLPGIDGVKIIKLTRQRVPNLAIIAISGVQLNSSDRTALDYFPMIPELSSVPCLKKPFRPNQLTETIEKVMRLTGKPKRAKAK